MSPEAWREAAALQAVAHYWREYRRLCRHTFWLRMGLFLLVAWCAFFGVLAFINAMHKTKPLEVVFYLACSAFDLTIGAVNVQKWPSWPKPDPRMPRP